MRTPAILAMIIAISGALSAPVLAKNTDAQKGEEDRSSCSAYQQAPDGSWMQLPCKETGERDQRQTQHRSHEQGTEQETR